jgi:hypothetical protein
MANQQQLRVVTMHNVEPFVFEDANGTFSGYLVDLLRPLLDHAGLTQPAEIYAVDVRLLLLLLLLRVLGGRRRRYCRAGTHSSSTRNPSEQHTHNTTTQQQNLL